MRQFSFSLASVVLATATVISSCGYHVAGKADTVPHSIQTIAVLAFPSGSNRYRFSDKVQEAISRELIARTRFHVVRDPKLADAVLQGSLGNLSSFPVVFDPQTTKTTVVQINVVVQAKLTERKTGKVIYNVPSMNVQNNYQISEYASQYFDESSLALDRVCTDVARTIVSGILSDF